MSNRQISILGVFMVALWVIIIGCVLWAHISVDNYTKYCANLLKEGLVLKQQQTCNEYCNCSITQDCPYTFDYDEVKDCGCKE